MDISLICAVSMLLMYGFIWFVLLYNVFPLNIVLFYLNLCFIIYLFVYLRFVWSIAIWFSFVSFPLLFLFPF